MGAWEDFVSGVQKEVAKNLGEDVSNVVGTVKTQITNAGQQVTTVLSSIEQSQKDVTQLASFSGIVQKYGLIIIVGVLGLIFVGMSLLKKKK